MINPITGKRVYFIAYMLIWLMIFLIQVSIEYFVFNLTFMVSLSDSLISNFLFFVLGIILWYPLRYMTFSGKNIYIVLFNHFITGLFFLGLWLIIIIEATKLLFNNSDVQSFIDSSISFKAIFGGLIFILLIMIYYLIIYSENLKIKISNEANLKTLIREAELSALKTQINPHFLFNSLNSISSLTISNPSVARKMIIELSEFLRYSLKFGRREVTSLSEEMKNIHRYMDIERIRFGERLIFINEIPDECMSYNLPNMILQPLFENAIKHGVYESIEPVTISMKCSCNQNELLITITNNFDEDQAGRAGTGLGLKNISNRLRLIYGRDDLIVYGKEKNTFRVSMKIPTIITETP